MLSTTSFEKALFSLNKAITRAQADPLDEEVRDATIQRFEYSYELAFKMLKRQIELESASPAIIDRMSFKELLREALEKGMIDSFDNWLTYRHQRNITSHTYNEEKAIEVFNTAVKFYPEAKKLLIILQDKNND